MYGVTRTDARAQLAVMDAIVFFAVCTLICAFLVSSALSQREVIDESAHSAPRADEILSAYLGASLGEPLSLGSPGLELTGAEPLCEVLFVIASLLSEGREPEEFLMLFSACSRVLEAICIQWSPMLRLSSHAVDGWTTLIEVGAPRLDRFETWSSTKNLGECGEATITVTLVLSSSLLLHDVGV